MNETTVVPNFCIVCKKEITDPIYECYWDKDLQEIVYRHRGTCGEEKKKAGPDFYMKKLGETKWD